MKRENRALLGIALSMVLAGGAAAATRTDRLAELERLALAGRDTAVLQLLEDTAAEPAWTAEDREGTLLEFTHRLQSMPPGSVGQEVIEFLRHYPAQVMVPHDDHPQAWVPRFNIGAAAAGIESAWRRSEAAYQGALLLARDPQAFVDSYRRTTSPADRRGLLDAMKQARPGPLEAAAEAALAAVEDTPALGQVAATAAVLTRNPQTLAKVLMAGPGEGLHRLLAEVSHGLGREDRLFLFGVAANESNPASAALAIAQLAPSLLDHAAVEDRLFDLLASPELGSAAALALTKDAGAGRLERLSALAESGAPGAARARLSLNLVAAERNRERPQ